jgi:Arc/MetJ-type ribon-helix-helix transcriptional regulator
MELTLQASRPVDIIDGESDIKEAVMVRTIISLPEKDKAWLDKRARDKKVPMTAVIREAVKALQEQEERQVALERALKASSGIWKNGDGLAWQRKMREEWR